MASVLPDVLSGSPELSAGERTVSVIVGLMIAAAGAKPQPNMARLIEQYGADKGLPDLRTILAGDCPRAGQSRSTTAAACITRSSSTWGSL